MWSVDMQAEVKDLKEARRQRGRKDRMQDGKMDGKKEIPPGPEVLPSSQSLFPKVGYFDQGQTGGWGLFVQPS